MFFVTNWHGLEMEDRMSGFPDDEWRSIEEIVEEEAVRLSPARMETPDGTTHCHECEEELDYECFSLEAEEYLCEACYELWVWGVVPRELKRAEKRCRITGDLPKYDSSEQFRCTRQEYLPAAATPAQTTSH